MNRERKVGLPLATMLVAGTMIGSGVYLLPASLAAIGSVTILAWGIALVGALLIAASLAHLGRIAPNAGGLCGYAAEAFGPFVGFQSNVLYWLCAWIGNIAVAAAAIGYLGKLVPWLNEPAHLAIGIIVLTWAVTFLNILGPRIACQVQSLTLIVGLAPIVLIAIGGWWSFDAETFRASWNVTGKSAAEVVPGAVVLVFWAFVGLESASVGTAVVENPTRNVPLATLGGVVIAGIVYMTSSSAIMGMIPASELAKSSAPFADAAQVLIGAVGGSLMAGLAFVKASGTLAAFTLVTAQAGKTAAEKGYLPAVLARTDSQGVPAANFVALAILQTVVTMMTISPTLNEQFNKLIEVSVLLCLIAYGCACAAVWRYPADTAAEKIRYRIISAAAVGLCVWVIAMSSGAMVLLTIAIVLIVGILYLFRRPARST